uniref:Uncharacterized protein n=1 Tax=Attheya septentrionalis TaxID=420275 RepID=A0A7S2XMD8_9STRA|mmetsp:Transcript_19097/g.34614  ORF Transcript_19097/g.34614 Transcript_19097/m.34614 type:complete len:249 (+) Transcript_19097:67-813(+)
MHALVDPDIPAFKSSTKKLFWFAGVLETTQRSNTWPSFCVVPAHIPRFLLTPGPLNVPSASPSGVPTNLSSISPTLSHSSVAPSKLHSSSPSIVPTDGTSASPSFSPSGSPSKSPTESPSGNPSLNPSTSPTMNPTGGPSNSPMISVSDIPTNVLSSSPPLSPKGVPTKSHSTTSIGVGHSQQAFHLFGSDRLFRTSGMLVTLAQDTQSNLPSQVAPQKHDPLNSVPRTKRNGRMPFPTTSVVAPVTN